MNIREFQRAVEQDFPATMEFSEAENRFDVSFLVGGKALVLSGTENPERSGRSIIEVSRAPVPDGEDIPYFTAKMTPEGYRDAVKALWACVVDETKGGEATQPKDEEQVA